jgi:hypothetical protein
VRRRNRQHDETVHLALVLRRHIVVGIQQSAGGIAARHFSGDLRRQVGNIERLDAANTGFAVDQPFPVVLHAHTEGRDHAETGYDDASHGKLPK